MADLRERVAGAPGCRRRPSRPPRASSTAWRRCRTASAEYHVVAHLRRVDPRPALAPAQARPKIDLKKAREDPRPRPLRPRGGEGAHPRVPRRAAAEGRPARADPLPRRARRAWARRASGRAIAEALGRPFVRVSVGGLRDEAEIKGHRRTYVGAMPGKILQAIKRAGGARRGVRARRDRQDGRRTRAATPAAPCSRCSTPSRTPRSSTTTSTCPFDLSRVFFVATANMLEAIPGPLRDRMEVVTLSGYTQHEKVQIARRHLVPRVLAEHGLTREARSSSPTRPSRTVIERYTREAGVRELQRRLARCAASARSRSRSGRRGRRRGAKAAKAGARRSAERASSACSGLPPFDRDGARRASRRWAWRRGSRGRRRGGEILSIEAHADAGQGRSRKITGRLGEVMRESFDAAFSWVRAAAEDLGHRPRGVHPARRPPARARGRDAQGRAERGRHASPRASASLFTGKPVRADLAMTGEITLEGPRAARRRHQGEGARGPPRRRQDGAAARGEPEGPGAHPGRGACGT